MDPIRIDDPRDPRVAAYLDIRERDLAGRQGRFVAEGKVVLDVLLSAGRFAAESVLVLENRLAGLDDILRKAPADLPVYVARKRRHGQRSPASTCIAAYWRSAARARRSPPRPCSTPCLPDALIVVLVGISNHDNIGVDLPQRRRLRRRCRASRRHLLRSALPQGDPRLRRCGAESSLRVLRRHRGFIGDARPSGLRASSLCRRAAQTDIRDAARPERLALYLGTEGEGLPESLLARLRTVRIAMAEGFDSLNVAAASAIALHHFSAGKRNRSDGLERGSARRSCLLQRPHAVGKAAIAVAATALPAALPSALAIGESGPSSLAVRLTTSAARSFICSRSSALTAARAQSSRFRRVRKRRDRPSAACSRGPASSAWLPAARDRRRAWRCALSMSSLLAAVALVLAPPTSAQRAAAPPVGLALHRSRSRASSFSRRSSLSSRSASVASRRSSFSVEVGGSFLLGLQAHRARPCFRRRLS